MKPLLVIAFTVFLDLIGFGIVIPLLPFYAESYGAGAIEVTLLMAVYSLMQFLFAPVWGALSDRHGRRPILLVSIGMGALALAGFAVADTLLLLFVCRALHGVFAANISTAQAYIADVTKPEDRAKGMGLIGAAFGVGFTLGPWIGGELSVYGLSAPIWVASALSALNFVLAWVIVKESLTEGKRSERRPRPISPAVLASVLRHPVVGATILLAFVTTLAFAMMEATFALFMEHDNGLGAKEVGRLLGISGLTMVLIQGGLIGRLAKRFGEGALLRAGVPLLGLSMLVLVFAQPGAQLIGAMVLLAVAHGITQPSLHSLMSKKSPESEQGFVLGTNQSLAALARVVGPTLGGLLYAFASPGAFYGAAAVLGLATLVAFKATAEADPVPVAQGA